MKWKFNKRFSIEVKLICNCNEIITITHLNVAIIEFKSEVAKNVVYELHLFD
jgi:hypothetical protein